jgi:pilus assembly protein CpaD
MDPFNPLIALGPLLVALVLACSGCAPDEARWSASETPKENKLSFVNMTQRVEFAPGSARLTLEEDRALDHFLAAVEVRAGDQLTVELGDPPGAVSASRKAAILRALRRRFPKAELGTAPVLDPLPRDAALLRVGRYVVTGPNCPDWTKPDPDDYTNTPSSNFGCATVANLGLMVANPADLVRGAGAGGGDAIFAARGIGAYRSGVISKSLTPTPGGAGTNGEGGQGTGYGTGTPEPGTGSDNRALQ